MPEKNPYDRDCYSILETLDVATGERTVLREFDYVIEAPNWLPDGRRLLYNSHGSLWLFDLETKESKKIDTGDCSRCNNDHVLSPDGDYVGFSCGGMDSQVYIVPITGGKPRTVTPNSPSFLHGWSPDGKTLAYCAFREGGKDVYAISAEGGEETRLTSAPGLNDGPEYSPDGRHIWFNSERSGLMQIWRMDADGRNQIQMTTDEDSNSWFAHLSPDGSQAVYIAYKKGDVAPGDHPANKNVELRLMSAQGGDYRMLCRLFGGQGTLNVNSWSPCGKKIAFVSYRMKG